MNSCHDGLSCQEKLTTYCAMFQKKKQQLIATVSNQKRYLIRLPLYLILLPCEEAHQLQFALGPPLTKSSKQIKIGGSLCGTKQRLLGKQW